MTTTRIPTDSPCSVRRLAGGALFFVDASGRTEPWRCSWLVRVPSGCPEPDFITDTYRDVECGAQVYALPGWESTEARVCAHGHDWQGREAEAGWRGLERETAENEAERTGDDSLRIW